jgi:hypothetical protein
MPKLHLLSSLTDEDLAALEAEAVEKNKKDEIIVPSRFCAASLAGKPVPQRQWLIPDIIPDRNVTLIGGDGP